MNYYWVYILRCADKSLYTGITTDTSRRVNEHNGIFPNGARYTKTRRPVHLVYKKKYKNRSEASKEESRIKSLSKQKKEILLN